MKKGIIEIILVIAIIGLTILLTTLLNKTMYNKRINNIAEAYSDTLTTERNDKGQLVSTIQVLSIDKEGLLEIISVQDSIVKRLYNLNETYKGRNTELSLALAINNQIVIEYKDSLLNSIVNDTIINDTVYPTYNKDFKLKNPYDDNDDVNWVIGNVNLGLLEFKIDLLIRNEYDVAVYRKRKNIFHSYKTYAKITNRNPYDGTKEMRVLSKNNIKRKKFVFSAGIGYGITSNGLEPNISLHLGYKILEF